jgi:hypothetical protein
MKPLANNPYCVWYHTGHTRTFRTLSASISFAKRTDLTAVIGRWCDEIGWWREAFDAAGTPLGGKAFAVPDGVFI